MGKRQLEPMAEYLRDLGVRPLRNERQFFDYLISELGEADTNDFFRWMEIRGGAPDQKYEAMTQEERETAFYEYKNKMFKRSFAITIASDYEFIRSVGDWIKSRTADFKGEVLDLGCDIGILTCFIAKLHPECRIVGVDRCAKALGHAKEVASRIGIKNVEFLSPDEIKGRKFDTVFTSRTLQENGINKPYPEYETLVVKAATVCDCISGDGYPEHVVSFMRDTAKLLVVFVNDLDTRFLGNLLALQEAGVRIESDSHLSITQQARKETSQSAWLQCAVFSKAEGLEDREESFKLLQTYADLKTKAGFDWGTAIYHDDDSATIQFFKCGTLIRGFRYKLPGGDVTLAQNVMYRNRDDETAFWYESHNGDKFDLRNLDVTDSLAGSERMMVSDIGRWKSEIAEGEVYELKLEGGSFVETRILDSDPIVEAGRKAYAEMQGD